jgi:hypothetical protein
MRALLREPPSFPWALASFVVLGAVCDSAAQVSHPCRIPAAG